MAFGIIYVSKFLFGRLCRRGAIELIQELSPRFGVDTRLVAGHAAHDQPCEFWSFLLPVRTEWLAGLLDEKLPKLFEDGP